MKRISIHLLFLVSCLCLLAGCKSSDPPQVWRWNSIAFDIEIYVECPNLPKGEQARIAQRLSERTTEVENLFSLYLEQSQLSRLNGAGVLEVAPEEFIALLRDCVELGDLTKGLFDVSVQPLWDFWQGGQGGDVDDVLNKVNYKNIVLDEVAGSVWFKTDGMKLTFNGIVQGYLTDQLWQILKEEGLGHALINAGEYRVLGDKGDAAPWEISVHTPNREAVLCRVPLKDGEAMAVSAGYGHTFDVAGKSHHLFHPENAVNQPANRTIIVTAKTAKTADAIATSFAVCPQGDWQALLLSLRNSSFHAVKIYENEKLVYSFSE